MNANVVNVMISIKPELSLRRNVEGFRKRCVRQIIKRHATKRRKGSVKQMLEEIKAKNAREKQLLQNGVPMTGSI